MYLWGGEAINPVDARLSGSIQPDVFLGKAILENILQANAYCEQLAGCSDMHL